MELTFALDPKKSRIVRRAEKVAQERLADKRDAKKSRFNKGRTPQKRPRYDRDDHDDYGGRDGRFRSMGSARSQNSAQKSTFVPDGRRNQYKDDACFSCGEVGHYRLQCPNRGQRRDRYHRY